jgi:uncharacterized protein (UPF0305 family)
MMLITRVLSTTPSLYTLHPHCEPLHPTTLPFPKKGKVLFTFFFIFARCKNKKKKKQR